MAIYKHEIIEYTGDDQTDRQITGVGFLPDLVMIKAHGGGVALSSAFRTKDHTGTISQHWTGGQLPSQGIESLDFDGFTVGDNDRVNQLNVKYVAVCVFAGSEDFFKVGTYQGDGNDNRDIVIAPGWSPMFIFIKHEEFDAAFFRSISHSGDDSSGLQSDAVITNQIQGFNADGFQVGTDAGVNDSGRTHYWFAWRNLDSLLSPFFEVGSYIGTDGILVVGGLNFQPVWAMSKVQDQDGHDAVWRHSAHPAGNGSGWNGSANGTLRIKSFGLSSFTVGIFASNLGKTHEFLTIALDSVSIDTVELAVTDVSPTLGLTRGQTLMTITGSGFEPGVKVTFDVEANEDATDIVRVSDTQITCRSPAHAAGLVGVVVTNPTLDDNDFVITPDAFDFIAPTLDPPIGEKAGGTEVIIRGADFLPGQRVFFGLIEATQVQFVNAQTLVVIAPPQDAGFFDVTIEEE